MAKTGIIGAMEIELTALKKNLASPCEKKSGGLVFTEGLLNGKEVVIVKSGIGKVNAALCAQRLISEFNVSSIINTGIAGAMAQGLKVLDFVVSTDAIYHDVDVTGFGYKLTEIPQMDTSDFKADPALIDLAEKTFASLDELKGHTLISGRIASGDQFISDRHIKEKIRVCCNPACVEMEGAAIAHTCHLNNVPFVIIRCMSDMADDGGESLYEFNEKTAANLSASLVMGMIQSL